VERHAVTPGTLNLDRDLTDLPDWPTTDSHAAWQVFTNRTTRSSGRRGDLHVETIIDVTWYGAIPEPSAWLRVTNAERGRVRL
jgi:hypothetical protein